MSEWQELCWGNLATLEYGKALRGYQNAVGPYQVYGTNGPIGWHTSSLYNRPSVIIGRKGAYRGVHYAPRPFYVIDTAFYLKPKKIFDMRWAYYEFLTHDINTMDSGSAIPSTSREDFYQLPVLVPPLDEQHTIASVLSALDDKIDLNRRMNETLEAMSQAIFKDWFVDFGPVRAKAEGKEPPGLSSDIAALFPDAFDDDDKPVGWGFGCLGDVAESPRRGIRPGDVSPETPYIGLEHMPRRSIALTEWEGAGKVTSGKSVFKQGELLFGKLRPYFHKVGVAPLGGICSTDIVVLRPISLKWSSYVLACISSDEFVAYTNQTSTGTKMPRTSWKEMARYQICLPSIKVTQAFQSMTQSMIDRVIANIHENRTLAQLRDLLLPKLLSGEIRLREAEKAVEAVA